MPHAQETGISSGGNAEVEALNAQRIKKPKTNRNGIASSGGETRAAGSRRKASSSESSDSTQSKQGVRSRSQVRKVGSRKVSAAVQPTKSRARAGRKSAVEAEVEFSAVPAAGSTKDSRCTERQGLSSITEEATGAASVNSRVREEKREQEGVSQVDRATESEKHVEAFTKDNVQEDCAKSLNGSVKEDSNNSKAKSPGYCDILKGLWNSIKNYFEA